MMTESPRFWARRITKKSLVLPSVKIPIMTQIDFELFAEFGTGDGGCCCAVCRPVFTGLFDQCQHHQCAYDARMKPTSIIQ